jgi:hypothetical protein
MVRISVRTPIIETRWPSRYGYGPYDRGSLRGTARDFDLLHRVQFPASLGPGVYSASNRNKYQNKKNVYGE